MYPKGIIKRTCLEIVAMWYLEQAQYSDIKDLEIAYTNKRKWSRRAVGQLRNDATENSSDGNTCCGECWSA